MLKLVALQINQWVLFYLNERVALFKKYILIMFVSFCFYL